MGVHIGSGVSTHGDARIGAIEAASAAREGLAGEAADIAIVFAAGAHLAAPEATLEGVQEALRPEQLIGCGAAGVLGCGREHESGTAVAVWAAALGDGTATTFHATAEEREGGVAIGGLPPLQGAAGVVLLPDPYSFPTDALLRDLAGHSRAVPVLGGVASARTGEGTAALFHGDRVCDGGAVGARFDGVELLPCVSQGAAPLGPELTITAAEGHVIHELAGEPALERVRAAITALDERERGLIGGGLLMGIVIDGGKPDYEQGDFLVRGVLGADPESSTLTVGAPVRPGQIIRLHARDAASADRDLRAALGLRMQALGGRRPAGALLFSCNGRGRGMFGIPDHDAEALATELGGAPAAGFFAAGEIGPVGGESFLHGFTATVAVFAP
jgi:small ligand-binding sensory domain FIST